MKKILTLCAFVLITACTNAQTGGIENIPNFHILNTDSVKLTAADLKKNKPVLFIYFSPDCTHCQHMMMEMKPYMKDFKNTQVVMITFVNQLRSLQDFRRNYGLAAYPNFIVGTEGYTYEVQQYFHIKTTPFIALYGRNGKLVKTWEKAPAMKDLADAVKKV
ncbi:TlpA family protein disulfide reductase [Mucilaginibacter ginkgonis]|uniref:Redoxin domain-containing protein n=1 Tax=Mucilaginibacter ginkgonis TaxID=2682091 RepID=A0A7T7F8V6_9SPHI|nr:thioredoxin-like domain-containing protein [Mucilaginibacter ginkgonis]QQL48914.1 redoxin domain-containing protein [Mucilaginibacter ginkgonis]